METTEKILPEIEGLEIAETLTADVVICGGGHAGTQCALAAAENGATVIVLEMKPENKMSWIGEQIATFNSEFLASKGIEKYDLDEIIDEFCRSSNYQASRTLFAKYVRNSAEMIDHAVSLVPADSTLTAPDQCNVHEAYGKPKYPVIAGGTKTWAATIQFRGSLVTTRGNKFRVGENSRLSELEMCSLRRSVELGAKWMFGQNTVALVTENGRVTGAVAKGGDGKYRKFIAKSGTVLTTGSFSKTAHTLGVAVGGHIEPKTRNDTAPFDACNGAGKAPFLYLNRHGKRFFNESEPYEMPRAIDRQAPGTICCVTDKKYMQTIQQSGLQHGNADFGMPAFIEQYIEDMGHVIEYGAEGYDVRNLGLSERETAHYWCANTLEELAGFLGYEGADRENFLASVARYNQMCYAGYDSDYGKSRNTLIPVDEAPFFGAKSENTRRCEKERTWMLAPPYGLDATDDFEVVDADQEPIPGLYVAGNTLGNRFGPSYATPCGGVYIGSAMTHGRILGKALAVKRE